MIRYQNIFTQVQLAGPPEMGIDLPETDDARIPLHWNAHWFGKLGLCPQLLQFSTVKFALV